MLFLGGNVFVELILINYNIICTRTSFAPLALIRAFGADKLLFLLSLNYACLSFTGQSMEELYIYLVVGQLNVRTFEVTNFRAYI